MFEIKLWDSYTGWLLPGWLALGMSLSLLSAKTAKAGAARLLVGWAGWVAFRTYATLIFTSLKVFHFER